MTYSSPTAFRFIVVEFFYRKVSSISQHTKISRLSRITQSNNNKIKIYKEFVFFSLKGSSKTHQKNKSKFEIMSKNNYIFLYYLYYSTNGDNNFALLILLIES